MQVHPVAAGMDHLGEIARHSAGLAAAAAGHLDAPVEHCPGWSVADLVYHLTEVQCFWERIARERPSAQPEGWPKADRAPDAGLTEALLAATECLVATLQDTDPATPVWTWAPTQQDVAFIVRHQVQEAVVHRWDAAHAAGNPFAIQAETAVDAVEEFLTFSVVSEAWPAEQARPLDGDAVVLAATDAPAAWRISDGSVAGTLTFERVDAPAVATLRASASDLLLWLFQRVHLEPVAAGDEAVLARLRRASFTD